MGLLVSVGVLAGVGVDPAAAAPPLPPPVLDQWQLANPVFQESVETRAALARFEDKAVAEVMQTKSMPASDEVAVRALARNDIRAQMWADLGVIMLAPAGSRSADESLIYTWFAKYVKETERGAASAAVDEYVKWSGLSRDTYADPGAPDPQPRNGTDGYCNYRPPGAYKDEFNASQLPVCADNAQTVGQLLVFSPPGPTYEDFVKYGQYDELNTLSGDASNATNPLTYNDLAAVSSQAAADISMGAGIVLSGLQVPLATALSKPLAQKSTLLAKLAPFAQRVEAIPNTGELGELKVVADRAQRAFAAARVAADKAAARAAGATAAEADAAFREARTAAEAANEAKVAASAGSELFGGVVAIFGAVVDIVLTTTLASIQINSDLARPQKLAKLYGHASSTTPDLGALLTTESGYAAMFATFLQRVLPEAEPNCTGFVQVGTDLRACANPPAGARLGDVPAWSTTEPQFLNLHTPSVISTEQVPRIQVELPDHSGTLWVRPHGEGWWILQEMLPDGGLTREWMSTSFAFIDPNHGPMMAERIRDATGKYFFSLAPIGTTAASYACPPSHGAELPAGLSPISCLTDSLDYVAAGGRAEQVFEMIHGSPPEPQQTAGGPSVNVTGPLHVIAGQPVTYTATVFDSTATPLTYQWLYSCTSDPSGFCFTPGGGDTLTIAFDPGSSGHVGLKVTNGYDVFGSSTLLIDLVAPNNTISFDQLNDMTYNPKVGDTRPSSVQLLSTTASSGLPVAVSVAPSSSSVCQATGTTYVTILGPGTCTLVATQGGNDIYPAASVVSRAFSVARGDYPVTITDSAGQYSDESLPLAPQLAADSGDGGITGQPTGCQRITGLTDASQHLIAPPGSYPLSNCTGLSSDRFNLVYNAYTTVAPEDATITDNSQEVSVPGTAVMVANLAQANDGSPADLSAARVDFLLFRSSNSGSTPDYKVINQLVNVDGVVARTIEGLPGDTYRLVLRTSPNSAFAARTVTTNLVVHDPMAPSLTQVPGDAVVDSGATATFTSAATGYPTPSPQWYQVTSGPTFTPIPGATAPTLTTSAVTYARNGEQYIVRYTNPSGTANSGIVTLTVRPAGPVVTTQPHDVRVAAGGTASFSATASGDPAPTVQWSTSRNGGRSWSPLAGATSTTLTMHGVAQSQNRMLVRATFTNVGGTTNSQTATLTVGRTVAVAPVVTSSPTDTKVTRRATATFTATATGSPTPTVQWQVSMDRGRSWRRITGATSTTLTVRSATLSESGNRYRALFTNRAGRVTTAAASLTVTR